MTWDRTKIFLSKVIAWPTNGVGHVNLHFSMPNLKDPKGKDIVTGWPGQELDKVVNRAQWMTTISNFKNIWFCTSLQSQMTTNARGNPKAVRLSQNSLLLKALWIDIDVKPDDASGGHYKDFNEAFLAVSEFRKRHGLPGFSAIVQTGGGMHVYWISDKALTPDEWQPYAEGLRALLVKDGVKCDAGLTTDNCRLLRVPDTMNHKYDPPRRVELLNLPITEHDFAAKLAMLPTVAPLSPTKTKPVPADVFVAANFAGVEPAWVAEGNLSDGISDDSLLDPMPIFKECGFLRDALMTGGKDLPNPLWNLTTLCATFMEDGENAAHKMAKDHAGYSHETTQALYDRKLADRKARDMGYPKCRTIEANGSAACKTCPLRPRDRSPLNIRPEFTATVTPPLASRAAQIAQSIDPNYMMPEGFMLDTRGIVCRLVQRLDKKGNPLPDKLVPLFKCKIDSPWAQKDPDVLNFRTTTDKGNFYNASIRHEEMSRMDIKVVLARQKVKIDTVGSAYLEDFLLSWYSKLHAAQQAATSLPFGWYMVGDHRKGFVYGGVVHHDDGTVSPSGMSDPVLKKVYTPKGALQPWFDACRLITQQGRPALETMVAMAFAAPLMFATGKYGAVYSLWGDSGAGKSFALEVGLAVWGSHKASKDQTKATTKSVIHKFGQLKNLPTFWDEIRTEEAQRAVVDVIFTVADGVEQSRLNTRIEQQVKGEWQSNLSLCSNISLAEYIAKKQRTHSAGLNRILECKVTKPPPGSQGIISSTDADRCKAMLETNYGMMGLEYAKFLATNVALVDKVTYDFQKAVEADLNIVDEERFWTAMVGTCLAGAKFANMLGASFNEPAMKDFLYQLIRDNRSRKVEEALDGSGFQTAEELLAQYLGDRMTNQTIWTDGIPKRAGNPHEFVQLLRAPDPRFARRITVRWDVSDKTLRISQPDFYEWLDHKEIPTTQIMRSLEKNFGMRREKRTIAAGTQFKTMQERLMTIPVTGPGSLNDILNQYNDPGINIGADAANAGADTPPDDTGIVGAAGTGADAATLKKAFAHAKKEGLTT